MGLRENLIANDDEARSMKDFIERYDHGSPDEGYTDEEAWNRYRQVSIHITSEDYREAAAAAVARLSAGQRLGLMKQLKEMGAGRVVPGLDSAADDQLKDVRFVTDKIVEMRQHEAHFLSAMLRSGADDDLTRSPNFLERMFGHGETGAARAVLGGIAANAAKKALQQPVGQAAH